MKTILFEDSIVVKELFDTEIMGKLTPTATQIIDRFHSLSEKEGVEAATNDYYSFAQKTNYIRTDRIAKICIGFLILNMEIWR